MYLHNTLKLVPSLTQLNIQDKVLTEVELPPKGLVFHLFFPQQNDMLQFAGKIMLERSGIYYFVSSTTQFDSEPRRVSLQHLCSL